VGEQQGGYKSSYLAIGTQIETDDRPTDDINRTLVSENIN